MHTWLEVKNAVNTIYKKHNSNIGQLDYVKDICQDALPHAIVQVLAMEMAYGFKDENTEIVIDGYKQLQKNACIKS